MAHREGFPAHTTQFGLGFWALKRGGIWLQLGCSLAQLSPALQVLAPSQFARIRADPRTLQDPKALREMVRKVRSKTKGGEPLGAQS